LREVELGLRGPVLGEGELRAVAQHPAHRGGVGGTHTRERAVGVHTILSSANEIETIERPQVTAFGERLPGNRYTGLAVNQRVRHPKISEPTRDGGGPIDIVVASRLEQ